MSVPVIESCCTTLEEARAAQWRGADRIELCVDLSVGGLTPPRDLLRDVIQALTIPVNVLIRPATSLDFVYEEDEIRRQGRSGQPRGDQAAEHEAHPCRGDRRSR